MPHIAPYLEPVQLFFILPFVAWWLLGASWLLQRSLRTKAGQRRQELGPCILGMLLAGLAAVAVGYLDWLERLQFDQKDCDSRP